MSYLESSFCLTPWGALQCELYLETEGPDFCILTHQSLAVSCLQEKGVSSQEKGLLLAKGKSALNTHWKNWCWSSSSNILATWCEESPHWEWPWCLEILRAGGEGDDRGWNGWMASPTQWTWVWAYFRKWWRTGKPGVLQSVGWQSQTQLSSWTTATTILQERGHSEELAINFLSSQRTRLEKGM